MSAGLVKVRDFAETVATLNAAQCRTLLRIGMPFGYQPPVFATMGIMHATVLRRLNAGEIDLAMVDAVGAVKRTLFSRKVPGAQVREAGRARELFATISPSGTIGLRPDGLKRTEWTTLEAVYAMAVRQRVAAERSDKARAKKARAKC